MRNIDKNSVAITSRQALCEFALDLFHFVAVSRTVHGDW